MRWVPPRRTAALALVFMTAFAVRALYALELAPVMYSAHHSR